VLLAFGPLPAVADEVGLGTASYYPGVPGLAGEFTAAHRSLPLGTCVRVTRLPSGRSVIVRINDRGPFVAGRIIDVSRRAADWLEMLEAGVVRVRVEIIPSGPPPGG
jgi:rare lipoprotein A (peptidoglycan hydrolase)